ncbi:MAG: OmpA family protein [Bdellovibrionales bacterium]|nr:OmpA family protein [Bdellovibrionales bacterium]
MNLQLKQLINIVSIALLLGVFACAPAGKKTAIGAGTGAVVGAGLGAIVGSTTGDAGRGVAIGGGSGAVIGGMLGNAFDAQDQELDSRRAEIARQQELIEENRRLIDELRRRGADVRPSQRGVVINLPDILFAFDSANLTEEARRTIHEISDVLREVKHRSIAVEGHTDSVGTFVYNQRLSERRAGSVASELKHNGVDSGRISVTGFGEGSPIATNNTDAGRARNRRVEVIVEN